MGLAGEYLVTGELLRRQIMATLTYGNAKKADVVIINEKQAFTLEVKTTSLGKWVLGNHLPDQSDDLWVLVFLPTDPSVSPEYYILTSKQIYDILITEHKAFRERYQQSHGEPFTGKGVVSVKKKDVISFKNQWSEIMKLLG